MLENPLDKEQRKKRREKLFPKPQPKGLSERSVSNNKVYSNMKNPFGTPKPNPDGSRVDPSIYAANKAGVKPRSSTFRSDGTSNTFRFDLLKNKMPYETAGSALTNPMSKSSPPMGSPASIIDNGIAKESTPVVQKSKSTTSAQQYQPFANTNGMSAIQKRSYGAAGRLGMTMMQDTKQAKDSGLRFTNLNTKKFNGAMQAPSRIASSSGGEAYKSNFTPATKSSSSTSSTVQHKDKHLIRRARRAYDKSIKKSESMTSSALRDKRGKAWFRAANEVATNAKNRYHEAIGVGTYAPESNSSKTVNTVGAYGLSAYQAGSLNNIAASNASDDAYRKRVTKNQADANRIQKNNYSKQRDETRRKNMADQTMKEWEAGDKTQTYSEYHARKTGNFSNIDLTGVADESIFDMANRGQINKSQMSHDQLRRWRASLKGGGE